MAADTGLLVGRDDGVHASQGERGLGADRSQSRVGMRRAKHRSMQQARKPEARRVRLESTKGKRDGLYRETKPGEPESPLGPLVARARASRDQGVQPRFDVDPGRGRREKTLTAPTSLRDRSRACAG